MSAGLGWVQRQWRDHPRIALALRAALAAAIAWAVAGVLPGPAADFPYYAPFGAVIATTFTLAGSVKESLQAVGAIAVGGLIAWMVDFLPITSGPLAVAAVVVPSVVVAGWQLLGPMGGWVPTAALFTLILGHGEADYVGAYAGLTMVGAVIGIAVNAAFPPLPLAPAQHALGAVQNTLGRALETLAEIVESDDPDISTWDDIQQRLLTDRAQLEASLTEVRQASYRNLRARRYATPIGALEREARVLSRLVYTVTDLADIMAAEDVGGRESLDPSLREQIASALRTIAEAIEATPTGEQPQISVDDVTNTVVKARRAVPQEDHEMVANAVLLDLRRAAASLEAMRD